MAMRRVKKRNRKVKRHSGQLWRYLRNYKFNSLLFRNFMMITLMVALPLSLLSIFYNGKTRLIYQAEISETNLNSLYRSADMLESVMREMRNFSYTLSVNENTSKFIYTDKEEAIYSGLGKKLNEAIKSYMLTFDYVDSIYIYSERNNLVIYDGETIELQNVTDRTWLPIYEAMDSINFAIESRRKNDFYPYYITLICPIKMGLETKGAVVVNINIEKLGRLIGSNKNVTQELFFVDESLRLYYSSDYKIVANQDYAPEYLNFVMDKSGDFSGIFTVNGKETIVSRVKSVEYSLSYILLSPLSVYETKLTQLKHFMLQVTMASLLFSLLVSYFLTLKSFEPVRNIIDIMENPTPLNGGYASEKQRSNEVLYITGLVRKTQEQNSNLKLELDERIKKLTNAQLHALQSQIDPHFLYNTLDTINWIAIEKLGKENEVSVMISTLAQLLRISLRRSSYLVTVEEEIQYTRLYMKIVGLRYKDKLQAHWSISEEIMKCKIVRFSIQPLVENALNHGLRAKRYLGNIYIRGILVENTVVISVEDDGVGMGENERHALNMQLKTEYQFDDSHVGIRNVNQRVKLLFGEKYGVVIAPKSNGGGLVVTIVLPCNMDE